MGTVESFVRLFRGRADAYGSWKGGCVKKPLTPESFKRHLRSTAATDWIGVYNVMGEWCSWGCVDIDVDNLPLAETIREVLDRHNIPAWIEKTTRGYHVWVFPFGQGKMRGRVEARMMRRALRAACLDAAYSPKEIFPKQDRVTGFEYGNYVRLPLNGSLSYHPSEATRRFIHPGVTLQEMDTQRVETTALYDLAARCPRDPQPVDMAVDMEAGLDVEDEVARIGGTSLRIWRDGPKEGWDRSSALVRLAHSLAAHVDPSEAYTILVSADQRWGKFHNRKDGPDQLRKIIGRAYGRSDQAPGGRAYGR